MKSLELSFGGKSVSGNDDGRGMEVVDERRCVFFNSCEHAVNTCSPIKSRNCNNYLAKIKRYNN